MFKKGEIISILIATIIIAFSISLFLNGIVAFLWTLLAVFIVILINVVTKKIAGFYFESDVEIKMWEINYFGFKKHQHFKKPFPIGAFAPLISKIILFPINGFAWMASLIFDVKPRVTRAARRHGLYSFSGMTEEHLAYIASAGIIINLIAAVVGYLIGFTEFSKLSIYFSLFNLLPLSSLDGNKIFFGKIVLWSLLACLVLVGIFFIMFII